MTWNVTGQMTAQNWSGPSSSPNTINGGIQYVYSATQNNGQITQVVDTLSGDTITYQYDALKRLTSAGSVPNSGSNPAAWTQTYQYDGFGNLTAKVLNGTATSIAVNAASNRLSNSTYDANGNMTSGVGVTFAYDEANRVVSGTQVSGGVEYYGYAPDNKRIYRLKSNGTTEEWTFYGARGEKLGMYGLTPGNVSTFGQISSSIWFAGRLIDESLPPNPNSRVIQDRLGTNRFTGARYRPYGDEITSTPNDFTKFATYFRDGFTGVDYADQRYYASAYGRFNSPDPYQASATSPSDPSVPQSWNRFAYVTGDPINLFDPGGTCGTPSTSGTYANGTIWISVSIPCNYGGPTTAPHPQPPLTVANYDDFHGIFPKCPSVTNAPAGLDAAQIQKHIDAAQQYLSNALVNDTEGTGFYQFLGYLTAQFAPRGAWDYKSDPQYGPSARDFGNFNFGAVLASMGASYYQTQNAAGVAQIGICILGGACGTGVPAFVFPYGDQVTDAAQIKKGWTYENKVISGCKP